MAKSEDGSIDVSGPDSPVSDAELANVVGPPPFSRGLRNVLIVLGTLTVITGTLVVVRAVAYSPSAAVDNYLSALEQRDGPGAVAELQASYGVSAGDASELLRSTDYAPPSDHKITDADTDGDRSIVTAQIRTGEDWQTVRFSLRRDAPSLSKVFRPWRIDEGRLSLGVSWPYGGTLIVAGRRIPAGNQSSFNLAVFPGQYQISVDNAVVEAVPVTAIARQSGGVSYQLAPTVKDSAISEVTKQVDSLVNGCVQQTSMQLTSGCPFSGEYAYYSQEMAARTLATAPGYTIVVQPAQVVVQSASPGTVSVTITRPGSSASTTTTRTDKQDFTINGFVYDNAGQPTFVLNP